MLIFVIALKKKQFVFYTLHLYNKNKLTTF